MNASMKKVVFVSAFALSVAANAVIVLRKCMTICKTYTDKLPDQKLHPRASLALIQTDPGTWLATGRNAAIPQYSGGRFGDQLLTVAQTLYFKNNCDMLYIPFQYTDGLVLDEAVRQYTPELAQHFKHTYTFKGNDNASLEEPLKIRSLPFHGFLKCLLERLRVRVTIFSRIGKIQHSRPYCGL